MWRIMSGLSSSNSGLGLPARLDALSQKLRLGGHGATILVHAQDPDPGASRVANAAPAARVLCHDSYDGLHDLLASEPIDACLSYRFGTGYPRAPLVEGPDRPAYVHVGGTGFDHLVPFEQSAVLVCNSAGFQAEVMADYALAAILAINMRFPSFVAQQTRREWREHNLRGARDQAAVVLGTGPIGAAIAERLSVAGLSVTGVSRSGRAHPSFQTVVPVQDLRRVAAQAEHLVIAIPLTNESRGLVSREILNALRPGAGIVNLARGGIVDEAALQERLKEGALGGAVFDVFETEPLPNHSPLWEAPGLIVTPHTSALFEGWERAAADVFCDNLHRLSRGEPLRNRIDPARGY